MFRLLPLTVFVLFASHAWAIQLGDSREQILTHYGNPTGGDMNQDRSVGMYRWTGWRLEVEINHGVAQRLGFTKEPGPIIDAEARQLLNDNGGFAAWQAVDHVALDTLANKKWRRTTDGAEAFTLVGDPRGMCLVTKAWADWWLQQNAVAPRVTVTAPAINPPAPTALTGLVICGFIGLIAWLVVQSKKNHSPANGGLWTPAVPPPHLEDSCPVSPAASDLARAASFPISNIPKQKTLEDLSWQEFELMVGELYRRQGYTVEMCSGDGSDGGVDLRLRKDGRTTLVQCKHWKVYKVGVSPVRELFGILNAEKADHAILVTTGRFTQDARAFAAGKPMELIAGEQLDIAIEEAKYGGDGDLLDVASWSSTFARAATITTPVCPFCRSPMVLRWGKQSGNQFWGCSAYPTCRGKRNVRPELMRV